MTLAACFALSPTSRRPRLGREEADRNANAYCLISESTEDRFDETDNLEEAIRTARVVAHESKAGDPVSIEHRGRVIRQMVLLADGSVSDEEIH